MFVIKIKLLDSCSTEAESQTEDINNLLEESAKPVYYVYVGN